MAKRITPSARSHSATGKKRDKLSTHHRNGLTESAEDYLECILNVIGQKGYVSGADIAESLNVIPPSVSLMIKRLDNLGYLKREPYRGFVLTPLGRAVAESIKERHAVLAEIFQHLGLDPKKFHTDIEGLEHHISEAAFPRFKQLVDHLNKNPLSRGV